MKKIMVTTIVTLMVGLGAYAQADSSRGGARPGTMHESDGDINNVNRNSNQQVSPVTQDSVHVRSIERTNMPATPHTRDSSGTTTGQQKKSTGAVQTPKPVQQQNTGVKTQTPVKQEQPKKVATEKDKMYLVPDSTIKK